MSKQSNLLLRPLRTRQAQNRLSMLGDWRLKSWDLVSTGLQGQGRAGGLKITNPTEHAVTFPHTLHSDIMTMKAKVASSWLEQSKML